MPSTINFREELDDIQYQAVTDNSRFIRVIAGAGSGKTRVLTYRFAHLVLEKHVSASKILCVTFTNKATEEMQERIAKMLGYQPSTIMTLNSLGNKILKKEIHRIGWRDYTINASAADLIDVLKDIIDASEMDPGGISVKDQAKYITDQKKKLGYLHYLTIGEESDIDEHIEQAKSEGNFNEFFFYMYLKTQVEGKFTGFNDQVFLPLMMFDNFPDMLETWGKRFSHILVDEFQDVSDANYELCKRLTGENNHLFVVGDPDQMIYGWRDATTDYLRDFEAEYPCPGVFDLMKNYRSTKNIVDAANRLIIYNASHNENRNMIPINDEYAARIKYYHCEMKFDPEGAARTAEAIQSILAGEKDDDPILRDTETEKVILKIKELLEQGVKGKDIAILYRSHFCADYAREALKREKIPYKEYKEDCLNTMPFVKKIKAIMRLIVSQDNSTYIQFENAFSNDIEVDILLQTAEESDEVPYFQRFKHLIDEKPGEYPEAEKLLHIIQDASEQLLNDNAKVLQVVEMIAVESGIEKEVMSYKIIEETDAYLTFISLIRTIEEKAKEPLTLSQCLERLEATEQEEEENLVRLSTIHAAKGLEFDYVFVIQMLNDIIPSKRAAQFKDLEEERRIAYVAFTRAKKELWISETSGPDSESHLSPFILEAGNRISEYEMVGDPLTDPYIDSVLKNFEQHKRVMQWRERVKAREKLPFDTIVEHPIYGRGIIIRINDDCSAIVQFEAISRALKIYDIDKLQIVPTDEALQQAEDDELLKEILGYYEPANPLQQRVRDVLDCIDKEAANEEHHDQVSVIGLPCGAGKSSAISLKICRTIAAYEAGSGEGLLIISPMKDQLLRYLAPFDPAVRSYIKRHMNEIVRMDGDNLSKAYQRLGKAPVLIMTNARYFDMDYFQLKDNFLTFGKGCKRTLIIMDEEPEVYQFNIISHQDLNDIDSAIKKGFTDLMNQEEKEFCVDLWDKWRNYLINLLNDCEAKARASGKGEYYSYFTEHDERQGQEWARKQNLAAFYQITSKNKYKLNFALSQRKDKPSIFKLIQALYTMNQWGAVYTFRSKSTGEYTSGLCIRTRNDIYFDGSLDAKIVILDGTAWVSPVYFEDRFHVIVDPKFEQPLENLTLKMIDCAAGQTRLKHDEDHQRTVIGQIQNYYREIPENEPRAIFTNKDLEPFFQGAFRDAAVDHFGNIRGKNEFKDMKYIVQVGMFRCPDTYYFMFELDANPKLMEELYNRSTRKEDTSEIISQRLRDRRGITKQAMDRLLICDIEQNLYRGALRKFDGTPFTYYLFDSVREYKVLMRRLRKKYMLIHKANVEILGYVPSRQDLFYDWYDLLKNGERYTNADIKATIGLSEGTSLKNFIKQYPDIQEILKEDRKTKGVYFKSGTAE